MSMGPHAERVWSTSACSCSLLEMLAAIAMACPPAARISSTTFSQASSLRLETTTLAPALVSLWAMDRPMPRLEPVTMATLSFRSNRDMRLAPSFVVRSLLLACVLVCPLRVRFWRLWGCPLGAWGSGCGLMLRGYAEIGHSHCPTPPTDTRSVAVD